jgi:hypothetical protein
MLSVNVWHVVLPVVVLLFLGGFIGGRLAISWLLLGTTIHFGTGDGRRRGILAGDGYGSPLCGCHQMAGRNQVKPEYKHC